jgi:hypothetical protein
VDVDGSDDVSHGANSPLEPANRARKPSGLS